MAAFPARDWLAFVIFTSWFYGIAIGPTVPSKVYIGKPLVWFAYTFKIYILLMFPAHSKSKGASTSQVPFKCKRHYD